MCEFWLVYVIATAGFMNWHRSRNRNWESSKILKANFSVMFRMCVSVDISISKRTDAINFFNYVFKMAVVFFALK